MEYKEIIVESLKDKCHAFHEYPCLLEEYNTISLKKKKNTIRDFIKGEKLKMNF